MKEQIKEIAKVLCEKYDTEHCKVCDHNGRCMVRLDAEWIYEAGYRKQSEGEWETIPDYRSESLIAYRHICSVCKSFYKDIRPHGHKYCHECGAKMKGADT
jgi:hypothetical protein